MAFRNRFSHRRDGRIAFELGDDERELMASLVDQMRELLMGTAASGSVDPSMRRLYPTAYADDPERDAEYQELMRDELLERRLESLDVVEGSIGLSHLDEETALTWLTVLNDIRLVLGTSLDVSEDDDFLVDPDDPDEGHRALYHYLGQLQHEFLDALMDD